MYLFSRLSVAPHVVSLVIIFLAVLDVKICMASSGLVNGLGNTLRKEVILNFSDCFVSCIINFEKMKNFDLSGYLLNVVFLWQVSVGNG